MIPAIWVFLMGTAHFWEGYHWYHDIIISYMIGLQNLLVVLMFSIWWETSNLAGFATSCGPGSWSPSISSGSKLLHWHPREDPTTHRLFHSHRCLPQREVRHLTSAWHWAQISSSTHYTANQVFQLHCSLHLAMDTTFFPWFLRW